MPATRPGAEHPQVGQAAEVVHVEVCDEDILEFIQRDTGGDVVCRRALADIEDQIVSVPELNEDRGVHLARAYERRTTHEDDAHLIGLDLFRTREPVRRALHPR